MYFKMNKSLLIIILALCFTRVYAQNNNWCFVYDMNQPIPLYKSLEDTTILSYLYQDTIKENYYSLQILDEKNDRFLVSIFDQNILKGTNWIEKKYCNVWCWMMSSSSIYLFSAPDASSQCIEIFEYDMIRNQEGFVANIIGLDKGTDWIKILIITKTSEYAGWTLNYCNNIYGSCEGWKATSPSNIYKR